MEKDLKTTEYKYGFHDEIKPLFSSGRGLSEKTIREMSKMKEEPDWMLDYRLQSLKKFYELPIPTWGPDLSDIRFEDIIYYQRVNDKPANRWEDVPNKIKQTFERLGIPEAERKFLSGAAAQYESEVVYHNMKKKFEQLGIIFMDTDSALKQHPKLVKKYFAKLVSSSEHKFAALNGAVWSGGTFIYVPKGVKCDVPIQTYFRINSENSGQFERSLIIVDEGASIQYIEGCTAPTYTSNSLHAATVELFILKDAYCRYTTIQNWADNVFNLVTERGKVCSGGTLEWIDGNLGSKINMKYPATFLDGEGAKAMMLSIAYANSGQDQDTGCKMYHNAPRTSSTIVSKSFAQGGGKVDYRGTVKFDTNSQGSKSHIECDTILMDNDSKSDTIPFNEIHNSQITLEHEAKVSKISEEKLFYLMSRGLTEEEATSMIIMGFIDPITKELPMEYAVELNQLIRFGMEGSVG